MFLCDRICFHTLLDLLPCFLVSYFLHFFFKRLHVFFCSFLVDCAFPSLISFDKIISLFLLLFSLGNNAFTLSFFCLLISLGKLSLWIFFMLDYHGCMKPGISVVDPRRNIRSVFRHHRSLLDSVGIWRNIFNMGLRLIPRWLFFSVNASLLFSYLLLLLSNEFFSLNLLNFFLELDLLIGQLSLFSNCFGTSCSSIGFCLTLLLSCIKLVLKFLFFSLQSCFMCCSNSI